ncbi:MAG: threonylcarbamoyl-AMP synthase [Acidimicrobiales bacterium]|nr:threonylcarbamoyl-AMP synthase [Acidimicrobiales bacterium]
MIIDQAEPRARALAAEALRSHQPVVIPTETVYGLAVNPTTPAGLDHIVALKQRPIEQALAVLVANADAALDLAVMRASVATIVVSVWPGPLTVVADRVPGVDLYLGGDPTSIGVRCPDNDWVRAVVDEVGPVAATSANRSGEPPVTTAAEAEQLFGPDILVIDGGTIVGEASTVVDVRTDPPSLLRAGPIAVHW